MRTEQLIRAMAADTTRPKPLGLVLPLALLAAAAAVAATFLPALGVRPDLGAALMQARVLVKQAFPLVLAVAAFGAALRLARPDLGPGPWTAALSAVPLLLGAAVIAEFVALPTADWMPALVGETSRQCLALVSLMSLPLLGAALWALRRGASTRPGLIGAIAGLMSGGAAAAIYAMHCPEDSPLFYAVWYVIPILAIAALGAALGRRWLRW
jgi:hypothetical protein